jgi:transposase-like protein
MEALTPSASNAQPADTKRRQWSTEERDLIVRASMKKGATVNGVARLYGVPLWQLYDWRKKARQAAQQHGKSATLLPVHVTEPAQAAKTESSQGCSMVIEVQSTRVTFTGSIDAILVRTVLECLAR